MRLQVYQQDMDERHQLPDCNCNEMIQWSHQTTNRRDMCYGKSDW